MDESRPSAQVDREVMATMLATNVQLVADVLRAEDHSPGQVMRAIAATRSLDMVVEDTLRALVDQARASGHTWAEIGELLRVSRQAAFQRFGGARRSTSEDEGSMRQWKALSSMPFRCCRPSSTAASTTRVRALASAC